MLLTSIQVIHKLLVAALRTTSHVNRLQIEIYGLKRVTRYSGYPFRRCLVENPILKSMRYEKQSVI